MSELAKRPLPTEADALAYAREMVPKDKWDTITIKSGSTEEGEGIILATSPECWVISYQIDGDETLWVDKATGIVVKMILDE